MWYSREVIEDELDYMYGLQRLGVKPGLEVMEKMMAALGHPERQFKSIHIAGTNGKGSTASFIASVLREAGYVTGLYISPHLVKFNERIQISDVEIADEELADLVKELRLVLEKEDIEATFFEFTTALAFMYFAAKKVDMAVIEVGMGGRLDATNVITPLVSVITNIGLDHMEQLGHSLPAIAREKAGIIKAGVPVVTGETKAEVLDVFREVAGRQKTMVHTVQEELSYIIERADLDGQVVKTQGVLPGHWPISLLGEHQAQNAATALLAVQMVQEHLRMTEQAIQSGMKKAVWPGRLEVISQQPLVVIDGAHNSDGMTHLIAWLQPRLQGKRGRLLLAMKRRQNAAELVRLIVPLFAHVIVTEGTYEPMLGHDLAKLVSGISPQANVEVIADAKAAAVVASDGLADDEVLVVTGSLYMIGAAREELQKIFSVRRK